MDANKIILPIYITESFVEAHKEWVFVYSCDLYKKGGLGQQWTFAGHSNTFGVPTLIKYCASAKVFFNDSDFTTHKNQIDVAIASIPRDRPILPIRKIGRGCSRMFEVAPKLYSYLQSELNKIAYPNIEVNYR